MAFYEREFIEIKRDNYKMKIVGPLKCSVEQEDVRQYIMACVRKEKIAIAMRVVLVVILWLFAALPLLGEFMLSSNPNPHIGPGMIALTIVFALAAAWCTFISAKSIPASKRFIANADPDSPEQLLASASDAVIWKQKKQWEICYSHDLVPLESVMANCPVFLSDGVNFANRMNDTERSLRRMEEKQLIEYAASLTIDRVRSSDLLMVYLDIDKLDSGVYSHAAGKVLGSALSASELEGVAVSSGDSAATLNGSANEYVVCFVGDGARLERIEAQLQENITLTRLFSDKGIRRSNRMIDSGVAEEPLVADGIVRNGELIAPAGHSLSFCAAGFNDAWKETKS